MLFIQTRPLEDTKKSHKGSRAHWEKANQPGLLCCSLSNPQHGHTIFNSGHKVALWASNMLRVCSRATYGSLLSRCAGSRVPTSSNLAVPADPHDPLLYPLTVFPNKKKKTGKKKKDDSISRLILPSPLLHFKPWHIRRHEPHWIPFPVARH